MLERLNLKIITRLRKNLRNQRPIHSIFIKAIKYYGEPGFERMRTLSSKTSSDRVVSPEPMIHIGMKIGSQKLIF